MKVFFVLILYLISFVSSAQNYILPDGEYMDTISNQNEGCKNRNVYYYSVGAKYPESSSTLLKKFNCFLKIKMENTVAVDI